MRDRGRFVRRRLPGVNVDLHPRLVEDTVRLLGDRGAGPAGYARERESLYEIRDSEARDLAFRKANRRWFDELGLAGPIQDTLAERPSIAAGVAHASAIPAMRAQQEGAELYVRPPRAIESLPGLERGFDGESARTRRRLTLMLLPATLATDDPGKHLLPLLRVELLHVSDMLDPAFGYEPAIPGELGGQTWDRLLLNRYSAIWRAWVLTRLADDGLLPEAQRPRPSPALDALLAGPDPPTHAHISALASDPPAGAGRATQGTLRCPLCAMPTAVMERGERLEPALVAVVQADLPDWRAEHGACPQCAELYRTHLASNTPPDDEP